VFQLAIAYCGIMLFTGDFGTALLVAVVLGVALGLVAMLVRNLF
jgi:hypothetical protein